MSNQAEALSLDPLSAFLDGPRARAAFVLRVSFDPPFGLDVRDRAPLTLIAMLKGQAWLVGEGGEKQRLGAGDLAIVRGRVPYRIVDQPQRRPLIRVVEGNRCETLRGEPLVESMSRGIRTWGSAAGGATVFVTGVYSHESAVGQRLLDVLPTVAVLRGSHWSSPSLDRLVHELTVERPGQRAVLDRLLDLVLLDALRDWFELHSAPWYDAYNDRVVGRALRLLHAEPARDWQLHTLARQVGASRATLARRFKHLMGETPMRYVAELRLSLAANLLAQPDALIKDVAGAVGYDSPFTFSVAFKRRFGESPSQRRRRMRSPR